MKKAFLIIFSLITLCLFIGSCGNSSDVPEGMKLASDTSKVYYSLFIPNEWIIDSSTDKITSAHASGVDRTSINIQAKQENSIDSWWKGYKSSLSFTFSDTEFISENEDIALGGLNGKRYVFTVAFGDNSNLKYELIAVSKEDTLYILTFTYIGNKENDQIVYTDTRHNESIKKIKDNFKFNDSLTKADEAEYEAKNVPNGMKCASDASVVDYYLFVPNGWTVEKTSTTVSSAYVSEMDKTNVSVMQWNVSSYDYDSWWNEYKKQLFNAFDPKAVSLNDKNELVYSPSSVITLKDIAKDCKLGENDGKMYTYSIKIDGNVYDYQVISTMNRASVYVMTFTFKGGCDMSVYQDDVNKIITNFRFS